MTYQTYKVVINNNIATVSFNRPEKANAMNKIAWGEMQQIFEDLDANPEVRVIILAGEGKHFCSGIDIQMLIGEIQGNDIKCEGRRREYFFKNVGKLQANITAIEKCRKPVLAAVHNICYGAGLDVITACDMRYCTEDAKFSIKEVEWGLVADVGVLQRLPKIIHSGIVSELAFTGRVMESKEAKEVGLVNKVFADKEKMITGVLQIAETIAEKSPLVIRGTKENILYARDHTVENSLNYQVLWNAAMIFSDDLQEAGMAAMQKRKAIFKN